MYLSRGNGWFDVDGTETYVRAGERFADSDPAVKALPTLMEKISDDGPPVKTAVKAAIAAAKGTVTSGDR